jgi:hypothetical protein
MGPEMIPRGGMMFPSTCGMEKLIGITSEMSSPARNPSGMTAFQAVRRQMD